VNAAPGLGDTVVVFQYFAETDAALFSGNLQGLPGMLTEKDYPFPGLKIMHFVRHREDDGKQGRVIESRVI
jgi:hypothetical protein